MCYSGRPHQSESHIFNVQYKTLKFEAPRGGGGGTGVGGRGGNSNIDIHKYYQLAISFSRAVLTLLKYAHLLGFLFELLASFQILGN
jgi:hypothetical protein